MEQQKLCSGLTSPSCHPSTCTVHGCRVSNLGQLLNSTRTYAGAELQALAPPPALTFRFHTSSRCSNIQAGPRRSTSVPSKPQTRIKSPAQILTNLKQKKNKDGGSCQRSRESGAAEEPPPPAPPVTWNPKGGWGGGGTPPSVTLTVSGAHRPMDRRL